MKMPQNSIKKYNNKKIATSGYRVLEILKALNSSPLTTFEMLKYLEEKTENVFHKEIVAKYIATLRLVGFEIARERDKYILKSSLEKIDFTKEDLSVMRFLEKYVDEMPFVDLKKNICLALQIVEKTFSKEFIEISKSANILPISIKKYSKNTNNECNFDENKNVIPNKFNIEIEKTKLFEKYCIDGLKLEFVYKINNDEKVFRVAPINVICKKGKIILIAYDFGENEYKEFLLELVDKVKQMPQKGSCFYPSTVTFRLTGRLAKSYILKKGERVLESTSEYLVISNTNEDKEMLYRRLARYYDKCEILYPVQARSEMLEFLNEIEEVYK